MPTKDEFVDIGYSTMTFYRVRNQYYDYLNARVEEKQEGDNPIATYEVNVAENICSLPTKGDLLKEYYC